MNETAFSLDDVAVKINKIISEYDFPLVILQDVKSRLSDSDCPYYAMQQLRYLENNVAVGIATKQLNYF